MPVESGVGLAVLTARSTSLPTTAVTKARTPATRLKCPNDERYCNAPKSPRVATIECMCYLCKDFWSAYPYIVAAGILLCGEVRRRDQTMVA